MTRHDVPGGGYFDLRPISDLNSDHQDEYTELSIEIRERKRREQAALVPVNPAVMPDPNAEAEDAPVRLSPKDTRPVRDLLLSWILTDSSFGVPVTWPLPLPAANVLRKALSPYYDALNGDVPKDPEPKATGGSATTSPDGSPSPLPAPVPASSATPAGS
jgi:hypothetical protein